jgi:prepilin-type N-terminal cleavage/methylation domain-containing protein
MLEVKGKGFTLIETLIVIAIISLLAGIIMAALSTGRDKARDAERKVEVSQMGRLLSLSCFTPAAGPGDYDIAEIVPELKVAYPQYASQLDLMPKDPSSGTNTETKYRYIVNGPGKCAVYANLESEEERVTLRAITAPTAGGGTGVFAASGPGWNGSTRYYQASN